MKKIICLLCALCALLPVRAQADLSVDLDTIVVTTGRLEQAGYKVAGNVSVITKEQIEHLNAQTIPDVLQTVEGLFVFNNSTAKSSTVDIRGFGDTAKRNVLVLLDGRKLNVIDIGGADLMQVPLGAVERIEVIRGGASVLYGDNAVGGVINIITKQGQGEFQGQLDTFAGSYDTWGQEFQALGEKNKLSYFLYGKYFDKRGYRKNSDELYKNTNVRLDYEFSDKLSMGVQYGFHEDSFELPGGLNTSELESLGRRGSANIGDVADSEDQYVKVSFDIDPVPGDTDWGHIIVDTTWRDRETFDTFNSFDFDTNREIETKGVTAKYVFDRPLLGRDVDFVTGIDYYDHENLLIGSGSNTDDLTISKEEFGVFGQLQLETFDDLYFIGGMRYHEAEYTFNQRGPSLNFEKRQPDEWVSSSGLKYEYGKGSNVHFNYQQTFRFLTTDEWYSSFSGLNTALEHQTGQQFEAGWKHNFGGAAVVSVTPYWIITNDEIFFDPTLGFFGANSNYDKIRRTGVEFGSRFDLKRIFTKLSFFDRIEYFANYTYQNPEFIEGANDGKKVPWVPDHQANTGVIIRFLDHYNLSVTGHYVGSRFAINDTGNALPPAKPYFVTDVRFSYNRDHYEIYLTINNIFEEKYETFHATNSSLTVRDVYPAPEKNVLGGFKLKF